MAIVFLGALAITAPTTGDLGLTWDEPAYRFSQLRSAQWWAGLGGVRSGSELSAVVDRDALLFYWPYARYGINFHPPLAGQLSLLTHSVFSGWVRDIPARRLASVLVYCLAITLAFGFLRQRYSFCVGLVAAGSLLLMPRVHGDGHIAGTDTMGLLLWPLTAIVFWKGLNEPGARCWRVLLGVLLGLAFLQKMAAILVLVPILVWLIVGRLPKTLIHRGGGSDWVDGVCTSTAMLAPLALALFEILRLSRRFMVPSKVDLFTDHPETVVPGVILAVPLLVWMARRGLAWLYPRSPVWGVERPALECWTAILAFAPVVGWLGCPAWWRETLPRLAHYYQINTDRRGALPDIQIFYLGQTYEYSLPWHNAWVLIGVTVPLAILAAAILGLLWTLRVVRRDQLPLYFLLHFLTLPIFRMFPTPAHDGVRLFLPTFFFLSAMAGWGALWLADGLGRLFRTRRAWPPRVLVAFLILFPSARGLATVHPYELSYYNGLIGGPRGAWSRGHFEMTYWYDAFNSRALAEINAKLPAGAEVDFLNDKTNPSTFIELQSLGELRPDLKLGWRDSSRFPYVWLLTQDSKASAFTRLLFALRPWYSSRPRQLDGIRVATVADPSSVATAWALWLLTDAAADQPQEAPEVPPWVRRNVPFLGRLWGEGLTKVAKLGAFAPTFDWAREDPIRMREAAALLAQRRGDPGENPDARRLRAILDRYPADRPGGFANRLFLAHPEALVVAVAILTERPEAVRNVVTRYPYTEPVAPGLPYLNQKEAQRSGSP